MVSGWTRINCRRMANLRLSPGTTFDQASPSILKLTLHPPRLVGGVGRDQRERLARLRGGREAGRGADLRLTGSSRVGYFDMLARYIVESSDWEKVSRVPLVAPSRDFTAMKLHLEAMAAARRSDAAAAQAAADRILALSKEPGQHPFVEPIITMPAQLAEAE